MKKLQLNQPYIPKEKEKKTDQQNASSITKPIKINWIIDTCKLIQDEEQKVNRDIPEQNSHVIQSGAKFGLCHCPGKKLAKGRDGKAHDRDLKKDLEQFSKVDQVQTIVCLLNEYELRTIGVDFKQYLNHCKEKGITFIHYPMIEMSIPECKEIQEFDQGIIQTIVNELKQNKNVICHCRGGIGRAGLMASCLLLKYEIQNTAIAAIQQVRSMRDKRCVESRKQESFVQSYEVYLKKEIIKK